MSNKLLLKIDYVRENVPQPHYTVTSEDVPGLTLAGDSYGQATADLVPAIETLFELNRGMKVSVVPLMTPQGDVVREMGQYEGFTYFVAVVDRDLL